MKFKPGTYQTEELIEFGLLQIGDGYRAKNSELANSGIPFARAGNINDGFKFDGADMFPIKDLYKVGDKRSRPCDSVFTSKGSVGRIAYVKEGTQEFVYSPQLCYWRSLDHGVINPRFLNFWMNGAEFCNQVDYLKGQTDMADYVSLRDQRKMSITIPEIDSQLRIAKILGDLNDKIELNRQINQTLEQITQAIFRSWFVDFDPVKAKAEVRAHYEQSGQTIDPDTLEAEMNRAAMRAISGKTDEELDQLLEDDAQGGANVAGGTTLGATYQQLATTAALFPSEFEESELGEIPKGWRCVQLKDITIKIGSGATPRGGAKAYVEAGVNLVRSQNVYDSAFKWDGLVSITDDAAEKLKGVTIEKNDILINITGASILRTCVVPPSVLPARVNQHVAILRSGECASPYFIHLHMLQRKTKDALLGLNAGGSREAVTKGHLETHKLLHPSEEVILMFHRTAESLFGQSESLAEENLALANAREALLPKLLSGEIITEKSV